MSTFDPLDPSHRDPDADPDAVLDADGARVRTLLLERAASVRPLVVPVGQVVRRARRERHRRAGVAVGAGLSAAAAVSVAVMVNRSPDPIGGVEAGLADSTTSSSVAPPPTAPGGSRYSAVPADAFPAATGAPLRMGLAVPGAVATSAIDTPEADTAPELPPGVAIDFADATGVRRLYVSAVFDLPETPTGLPIGPLPASTNVDLGGGVQASLQRMPVPPGALGGATEALELAYRLGPHSIHLVAMGLSEDEVLAVGRGTTVVAGPLLSLAVVPEDLVGGGPRNPWAGSGSGGVRTQVVYRLADGGDAVIDVVSRPGASFADAIEQVRAEPTAEVFLRPVRGTDAVVRRLPGMGTAGGEIVTVTWFEPTGNLVTVRLEPAGAGAADPAVVDGIVELDEAAFQALLVDPGPN